MKIEKGLTRTLNCNSFFQKSFSFLFSSVEMWCLWSNRTHAHEQELSELPRSESSFCCGGHDWWTGGWRGTQHATGWFGESWRNENYFGKSFSWSVSVSNNFKHDRLLVDTRPCMLCKRSFYHSCKVILKDFKYSETFKELSPFLLSFIWKSTEQMKLASVLEACRLGSGSASDSFRRRVVGQSLEVIKE